MQDALNRMIIGRTTVVVAHRLSTIKVGGEEGGGEGCGGLNHRIHPFMPLTTAQVHEHRPDAGAEF